MTRSSRRQNGCVGLWPCSASKRGLVGDPVVGEAAGALESLDRIGGPWSVASVIGPRGKPQSGELALELLDSLDAPGERPVGRAGPQRRKRGGMGNTVGRQAANLLEAADGLGGLWAVAPVDEARVKPQPGQLALQRLDPLDPLLGWFWFVDIQRSWPVDCAVLPCISGDPADGIATAASSAAICAAELVGSCAAAETASGIVTAGAGTGFCRGPWGSRR